MADGQEGLGGAHARGGENQNGEAGPGGRGGGRRRGKPPGGSSGGRATSRADGQGGSLSSNGPAGILRGTAAQIAAKYEFLAQETARSFDKVERESLLQFAEHYRRLAAVKSGRIDA